MIAARRLQGQYLRHLRALLPADRAAVRKIAMTQGVAAAVKLAERLVARR